MEGVDFKGSSRGLTATNVSFIRLDMKETVVEISGVGARAVFPFPTRHPVRLHHLETEGHRMDSRLKRVLL